MLRKMGAPAGSATGPDLERLDFWRGQDLGSRGLNDLVDEELERSWWHNRAIHDVYGVVGGLTVTAVGSGFVVQPGMAFDSYGRELLLTSSREARSPASPVEDSAPASRRRTLLLRAEAAPQPSSCSGTSAQGGVELLWIDARHMGIKSGVALAQGVFVRSDEGFIFELDEQIQVPMSRPIARPRLGSGSTPTPGTTWSTWERTTPILLGGSVDQLHITLRGLEVTVDTTPAGFTRTPCYLAWLQGNPWKIRRGITPAPLPDRVREAARDRFTFDLWDPLSTTVITDSVGQPPTQLASLLNHAQQNLSVCWIGIEHDDEAARQPKVVLPR